MAYNRFLTDEERFAVQNYIDQNFSTREEYSEASNISRSQVSKVLNHDLKISVRVAKKIYDSLQEFVDKDNSLDFLLDLQASAPEVRYLKPFDQEWSVLTRAYFRKIEDYVFDSDAKKRGEILADLDAIVEKYQPK